MTAQAGDTTSLSSRKAQLRQTLRQQRRALAPVARARAARQAAAHLGRAVRQRGLRHVAAYLGLAEELDTRPLLALLHRLGCALYVPKVSGAGTMRFARWRPGMPLRPNRYGIAEPVALVRPPRLDLIVLPLVAFDAAGRRLGMGGGYYDRLLARARAARRPLRVGYAFATQEAGAVPVAAHDVRLDAVVTENGWRSFR